MNINLRTFGAGVDVDEVIEHILLPVGPYPDFDFKTTPSIPATREHLISAIESNKRFCIFDKAISRNLSETAEAIHDAIKKVEWFDFGRLDSDDLVQCSEDAKPFLKSGLVRAPYEYSLFRVRLYASDSPQEVELLLLVTERTSDKTMGIFNTTVLAFRTNGARNEYLSFMSATVIEGNTVYQVGNQAISQASLTTLYEYSGLWTILNTRGIQKTLIEPDAKLNKARVRNNKPPLQRVIRINSAQYVTALRETQRMERSGEGMGHKSPRMHLRRGHMRTFRDPRFKGLQGKMKWIRPMIVGGGDTERIANRDRYEVKR